MQVACRQYHSVITSNTQVCPVCSSTSFTDDWAGYVVIAYPQRSEIAEQMDVTEPGAYALKVR